MKVKTFEEIIRDSSEILTAVDEVEDYFKKHLIDIEKKNIESDVEDPYQVCIDFTGIQAMKKTNQKIDEKIITEIKNKEEFIHDYYDDDYNEYDFVDEYLEDYAYITMVDDYNSNSAFINKIVRVSDFINILKSDGYLKNFTQEDLKEFRDNLKTGEVTGLYLSLKEEKQEISKIF